MRLALAAIAFTIAGGCAGPDNPTIAAPMLDAALFAQSVEPVLEARCSDPSCHGNNRRALQVFAPMRYRQDPTRLYIPESLSPAELTANEDSAAAFALGVTTALDSLLVAKPLGYVTHLGGTVFASPTEPDCAAVIAWLHTGGLP